MLQCRSSSTRSTDGGPAAVEYEVPDCTGALSKCVFFTTVHVICRPLLPPGLLEFMRGLLLHRPLSRSEIRLGVRLDSESEIELSVMKMKAFLGGRRGSDAEDLGLDEVSSWVVVRPGRGSGKVGHALGHNPYLERRRSRERRRQKEDFSIFHMIGSDATHCSRPKQQNSASPSFFTAGGCDTVQIPAFLVRSQPTICPRYIPTWNLSDDPKKNACKLTQPDANHVGSKSTFCRLPPQVCIRFHNALFLCRLLGNQSIRFMQMFRSEGGCS